MLIPSRSSLLQAQTPDRVVTLTALSDRVPTQFISETFSHSLRAETGGSVLLIHLDSAGAKLTLPAWAALQPQVNGEKAGWPSSAWNFQPNLRKWSF
jgi:hypothetical protein